MKKILKNWGIALLSALFIVCAAFMLMPAKTQVAEAALYPYFEATTLSDLLGDDHSRALESNSVVTISECTTSGQTLIIKYNGASDYSSDMSRLQWSYTITGSVSMSASAASVRLTSNKPMENLRFGGSSNSVYLTLESSTASSYTYSGTVINRSSYFGLTFGQFNGQIQDVVLTALEFQIYTGSVPQSCTVTLNKNNGTGGTDSVSASYGSAMPSATMPTRTGYTFKGYYDATSGGTQYYTSAGASAKNWDKSDETATLYAQWTANKYSITYKDGGGSNFSGTHASGYPTQHTYGTATTLKSATKTGYTFGGWFTSSNCTGSAITSLGATAYTSAITLYAKWTVNKYNITYKDGGDKTFSGSHESGYPTQHTYGTATTLKSATKTGYTFGGWFTSSKCTGSAITSLDATAYTSAITLYAKWTANTYTVTLDQNGGSGGQSSVSVIFDSKNFETALTQFPTMEGYTFAGYYDAQNAAGEPIPSGTLYIASTGAMIETWDKATNDSVLYAYFTKDMTVSATGYEAEYDEAAHTITVTVTDPASDYFILYRDPETSSNTQINPEKTNVGVYTIEFYVSKEGYTQYQGSATIVIKEVDKTALTVPLATDDAYYDLIKDDYSSIANDLKDIIDNIKNNIRDSANVTAAQVDQAVADLQTALSTAKVAVTEAKIDAIGSGDYSAERAAKIEEARNYYGNELTQEEQDAVSNYSTLEAAEALYGPVGEVVDEINALRAITDPQAFKEAVETARANYEALQNDEKAVFPDDTLAMLVDSEAIIPVVETINAIGDSEDTQDFRDKVADARTDYSDLTSSQKDIFPDSVLKVLTDDEAAIGVMNLINAIGTVEYTDACKSKIDTANAAYEALDASQKPLVANCDKLEQANTDYDKVNEVHNRIALLEPFEYSEDYKDVLDNARGAYEALTPFQKSIVPADDLKELVDDEKAYDAMAKIDAIGKPVANDNQTREKAETAREAVDALTPDQLDLIDLDFITDLENAETVIGFLDALNAIGDPEDTQYFRDKVANARDLYDALDDADLETLVDPADLKALTDIETAISVMDLINEIGDVEYTPVSKALIDTANEAYAALEEDQKLLVANYGTLIQANEDYDKVNEAFGKVMVIGDVEYTEESKALIDDARGAYDALSTYQKSIFPADAFSELVGDEKAYNAMDKINAIGTPENTDEFREKVETARETYDALTEDQKALVDVYPQFECDIINAEAVVDTMDKVNAIGEIKYTESSKDLIDVARTAYEELSEEQKELFPASVFETIEASEETYATLEKNAATLSTVMIIVSSVLLAAGIFLLILLLRKRKKDEKEGENK